MVTVPTVTQFCCGCSLKIGAMIIGVLNAVSENFPCTLLAVYRNVSSLPQEHTTLILKKLQFTRVAKLLAISIQIMFEQSPALPAHCLRVRDRKLECQKIIHLYFCTHQTRYQLDFGACVRLDVFVCCVSHCSK
jgi:hypothetical protein